MFQLTSRSNINGVLNQLQFNPENSVRALIVSVHCYCHHFSYTVSSSVCPNSDIQRAGTTTQTAHVPIFLDLGRSLHKMEINSKFLRTFECRRPHDAQINCSKYKRSCSSVCPNSDIQRAGTTTQTAHVPIFLDLGRSLHKMEINSKFLRTFECRGPHDAQINCSKYKRSCNETYSEQSEAWNSSFVRRVVPCIQKFRNCFNNRPPISHLDPNNK